MKFTIESFKTSIYRPAEWLMQNDAITHLFTDLNKNFQHYVSFSYGASGDGKEFFVGVYKNLAENKLSEDDCCCLRVNFLDGDKVYFEENFEDLYRLPSESKEVGLRYFIPYWSCVSIQKKITQCVFKVLSSIQEYSNISNDTANGTIEVIKVNPEDTINITK